MLTRRAFGCACLAGITFFSAKHAQAAPKYCAIDASFDVTKFRRFSTSGNRRLDRSMIAELRKVNRIFEIRPGYAYIDDSDSPNAFAHSVAYRQNTRGSIYFGLNLIKSELGKPFGGAAVAGIAAHEGAHIFQFFSDFLGELQSGTTAREMELHADFLAGYFFAASNRTKRSLDAFGSSLFEKGDYDFNNEGHHGTPEERLEAMSKGYDTQSSRSLNDAVQVGIEHVKNV